MKLISNPYFLFIVGSIFVILGTFFKITHVESGAFFHTIGLVMEAIAIGLFIYKKIKA